MATSLSLTTDYSAVTQYIVDLVRERNTFGVNPNQVLYGDISKPLPGKTITVFSGPFESDLGGNMNRTDNQFTVYLIFYFGKVQEIQQSVRELDRLANRLKDLLNSDLQMGGLVTSGYVRAVEPGFTVRENVLMRATRLRWEGYNRMSLKAVS